MVQQNPELAMLRIIQLHNQHTRPVWNDLKKSARWHCLKGFEPGQWMRDKKYAKDIRAALDFKLAI